MRIQKLFGPMPIGHSANILNKTYLDKQNKAVSVSPIVCTLNARQLPDLKQPPCYPEVGGLIPGAGNLKNCFLDASKTFTEN